MEFVFFSPGDYEATVTLSYHAGDPPDSFRTITQSAVVHVAAPQSVILLGAAVGGLLGGRFQTGRRQRAAHLRLPEQ